MHRDSRVSIYECSHTDNNELIEVKNKRDFVLLPCSTYNHAGNFKQHLLKHDRESGIISAMLVDQVQVLIDLVLFLKVGRIVVQRGSEKLNTQNRIHLITEQMVIRILPVFSIQNLNILELKRTISGCHSKSCDNLYNYGSCES